LELLVDGGLLSLLAFVALATFVLVIAFRRAGDPRADRGSRLVSLAAGVSFGSFLVDMGFSTNGRVSFLMVFCYLCMSVVEAVRLLENPRRGMAQQLGVEPAAATRRLRPRDAIALVAVSALVIAVNLGFCRRLWSEVLAAKAVAYAPREAATTVQDTWAVRLSYLERSTVADPRNVWAWYQLAQVGLYSGRSEGFFRAAAEVEKRIPRFEGVDYLRGVAYAAKGDYQEAERCLREYLRLDSFDLRAEALLVFVCAKRAEWSEVADAFGTVLAHDFSPSRQRELEYGLPVQEVRAVLRFPEDRESVRMSQNEDGVVVEFGVPSMIGIVQDILEDRALDLNLALFRFHYVLGNVYYSFGFLESAVRHFREAHSQYAMGRESGAGLAPSTSSSPILASVLPTSMILIVGSPSATTRRSTSALIERKEFPHPLSFAT